MAATKELEARITRLEEIEALRQLKYRYWRHLDLKQWQDLEALFVPEATADYGSPQFSFRGRTAILKFLTDSLGEQTGTRTIHHGHHPEIRLTGPETAEGRWALYNYLYNVAQNRSVRIGACYEDRYLKVDGEWKFAHIGYRTLFHEEWRRDEAESLKLRVG